MLLDKLQNAIKIPYWDVCSAILGKVIGTPSTLILALVHTCISLLQVPIYLHITI